MDALDKPKSYGPKIIGSIVILLIIVLFSVQNSSETLIKFMIWEGMAPLVIIMVVSFALGLCFALIALLPVNRYANLKNKRIHELESQISILENKLIKQRDQNF